MELLKNTRQNLSPNALDRKKTLIILTHIYLPTIRITSIRMLIALVVVYDLEIHQMDVKTTFLNRELEEEI